MQCVIKSSWFISDVDFSVIQCVVISYRLFSHSSFPVPQCVIKSFTLYDAITYAFRRAFLELPVTGWAYIKTCPPAMQHQPTLTHHLFIYTQPTHYASENASLVATCSPHGTSVHSAAVDDEQRWQSLWCRPYMKGGVECVLRLTKVAM
jgi:hypothetical protein